ncbi:MAG: hypothetical protein K1Y36_26530 [Blastocatellia bacterium]|nr:hypothetical protein [Blastocatellia bacterium]
MLRYWGLPQARNLEGRRSLDEALWEGMSRAVAFVARRLAEAVAGSGRTCKCGIDQSTARSVALVRGRRERQGPALSEPAPNPVGAWSSFVGAA